jgi:hypothetical protein
MQPKYKTERQLKARVYELALQNKILLDVLSFTIQDLQANAESGMDPEDVQAVLTRTVNKVKEVTDGKAKV